MISSFGTHNAALGYYSMLRKSQKNLVRSSAETDAAAQSAANAPAEAAPSKSIHEVAAEARAALDVAYAVRDSSTKQRSSPKDGFLQGVFTSLDFDRRSLFAIASNDIGLFTDEEVDAAQSEMKRRVDAAMDAADPGDADAAARSKAAIDYLDAAASAEERASFQWAKQRAGAQVAYQLQAEGQGDAVDDVQSGSPVVNSLVAAFHELFDALDHDLGQRLENMPSHNRALQQWKLLYSRQQQGPTVSITV